MSTFAFPLASLGALAVACSSDPATAPKNDCKPGDAYYCRCSDREEGKRVCNDDGKTYGPCEPCFPIEPPLPEEDASFPDEDVFVPSDAGDGGDAGPCPNGKVDPGEECDDGNRTANDGCSATCTVQVGAASGDKCPGVAVHVWDKTVTVATTTVGAIDDYSASPDCMGANGFGSPDRVFAVTAHKGKKKIKVTIASTLLYTLNRMSVGHEKKE